jgi:cytosine/adenosine deaminase-related metal-dependent hydrolase
LTIALRNARAWQQDGTLVDCDVVIGGDRVLELTGLGADHNGHRDVDLEGRVLLPGLVNGHDHLDFSTFPCLGSPPYANVYEWAADVEAGKADDGARGALSVALADRLFLGGLRNLLAGATAVAHHNAYHRSLGRADFPVRVLERYQFAHSPGLTKALRRTYRSSDRRIPWMVHAAEGTDERAARELTLLQEAALLRHNTVIVHGIALEPGQMKAAAAAGACVVWCPESNRHLYGATAPVSALRAAGVRVGLGSDSPVSGVRDALSNLAAARREGVLTDTELLRLATSETAEAVRLPAGQLRPGAPADLVAVSSLEGLLAGERAALDLVVSRGEARFGCEALMKGLNDRVQPCIVAGRRAALDEGLGRRAAALLKAQPRIRRAAWLSDVTFE